MLEKIKELRIKAESAKVLFYLADDETERKHFKKLLENLYEIEDELTESINIKLNDETIDKAKCSLIAYNCHVKEERFAEKWTNCCGTFFIRNAIKSQERVENSSAFSHLLTALDFSDCARYDR